MDAWSTHTWMPADGRRMQIQGHTLRHFQCEFCKRDFVESIESGESYAVVVQSFGFVRLSDEVTVRWLRAPCPDQTERGDEDDRHE
jgi:hypothetical protein